MPFYASPGVYPREIDLTTIVPSAATTDAAIAGVFRWGPIAERILVDTEDALAKRFGKPTNLNAETWFSGAAFLAYGDRLWVSRAANTVGISPDFDAYVEANQSTVILTGNNEVINTTSLGLVPGLLVLASTQNGTYISVDSTIDDVINSSAFTVSTASDIKPVSGSNTETVTVLANTAANDTVLWELTVGNTDNLAVGYKLVDTSNNLVANVSVDAQIASIVNSTAFTTDVDALLANGTADLTFAAAGTLSLQYVSNSAFSAIANSGPVANLEYAIIKNEAEYDSKEGTFDTDVKFIARYPGKLGNSLRVSMCGNSDGYSSEINLATFGVRTFLDVQVNSNTAEFSIASANDTTATANGLAASVLFQATDLIETGNTLLGVQYMKITSVSTPVVYGTVNADMTVSVTKNDYVWTADDTTDLEAGMILTVAANSHLYDHVVNNVVNSTAFNTVSNSTINATSVAVTFSPRAVFTVQFEDQYKLGADYKFLSANADTRVVTRFWEFFNLMDDEPGQSNWVIQYGNSSINSDEMHIVVTDNDGEFTGIPGTILEAYKAVSRASDAQDADGRNNFWMDVINDRSQFIYAVNDVSGATSATAENLEDSTLDVVTFDMQFGRDGEDEANIPVSVVTNAWDYFKSTEDIDISLVIAGRTRGFQLANYLIDNLGEYRTDCVVFISPQYADVVNNPGNEAAACVNFRNNLRSSSYGFLDSGYKKIYDKYNDLFRWVPLNGDMAGLCVRTDETNDPWWSPAGFNRGNLKNVIQLAFNPRKADRDTMYRKGINPVVSFPGQGTILYGDKTLLAKPSAFDRINVRRLFIVLRKSISLAARYTLFEFNDEFTRAQFKNLVNPYLRDVKGRRGIYDFLVVCDDTNNTPTVIDRNEFVGDIYIKPSRSINFIELNFVAVPTGVEFSEVVGRF